MRGLHFISGAAMLFLIVLTSACSNPSIQSPPTVAPTIAPATTEASTSGDESTPEATIDFANDLEDFDPNNFDNPTQIDNSYFPLKPGTQYSYEGITEEGGKTTPHRVIFTVTDLTKMIDGVRVVVAWDQDYSAGVLEESELAFFAQDNDGNVWHLGQYPEVYEGGKLVDTPTWITGLKGARAGIVMSADPQPGKPSYSQGWGPAVNWTDRAQVTQNDAQTCVAADCYENVLVIEEFGKDEPDAFQLKYYAPGVGNVQVGWRGDDATKETLELVEFVELSPEALADAHAKVLELEQRAYENSKEVYAETSPIESPSESAGSG